MGAKVSLDQTVKLRALEIIERTPSILAVDAIEQAMIDLGWGPDKIRRVAAQLGASALNGYRQQSYELPEGPETGPRQLRLFAPPVIIAIATPDGLLLIHKDQAKLAEVRQWEQDARQHYSVQLLRHQRAACDLALIEDLDGEMQWEDAARVMAERAAALPEGDPADD